MGGVEEHHVRERSRTSFNETSQDRARLIIWPSAFTALSSSWYLPAGEAQPLRPFCARCSVMLWACLKRPISTSPARGNGQWLPSATVRCSSRSGSDHRISCSNYQADGCILGHRAQEYLAGLDAQWEERLTRWTRGVQGALEEGIAPPLFSVQAAPSLRGTESTIESDPMLRG